MVGIMDGNVNGDVLGLVDGDVDGDLLGLLDGDIDGDFLGLLDGDVDGEMVSGRNSADGAGTLNCSERIRSELLL
jgi:hypothetical protein